VIGTGKIRPCPFLIVGYCAEIFQTDMDRNRDKTCPDGHKNILQKNESAAIGKISDREKVMNS
jgi:hypothetical protein